MEIGAVIPHNEIGTDPGAIKAYAQGAEELGVTHLLIYDHVVGVDRNRPGGFEGPYDSNTAFHEPFVLYGFLAACTSKVDLVTAIMILPQRQTVLAAKQAAEVAVLSNNRLRFGIGVGWNTVEYDALNEEFGNRGRRQEEQVDLMRRLWSEDVFSYEGDYHSFEHAGILPRPTEPIPVLFGGSAPALIERCARLGDGWIPARQPQRQVGRAHRRDAANPRSGRPVVGRLHDLCPGPVRRWYTRSVGKATPRSGKTSAPPTCRSPPTTPARPTSTATSPESPSTRRRSPTSPD